MKATPYTKPADGGIITTFHADIVFEFKETQKKETLYIAYIYFINDQIRDLQGKLLLPVIFKNLFESFKKFHDKDVSTHYEIRRINLDSTPSQQENLNFGPSASVYVITLQINMPTTHSTSSFFTIFTNVLGTSVFPTIKFDSSPYVRSAIERCWSAKGLS